METKNKTLERLEQLKELLPEVITETKDANGDIVSAIDAKKLEQLLSTKVIEGDESYDFTWVGKKQAMVEASRPIRKTLRPCKEESVDWEKTENLYIYENIKEFILSSGMKIENGYDCDLIYLGDTLFGVLHCTNGNMYVNINKNFQRYDNKLDRSGYICIPHAGNLESAKKRINSVYRAYFMDMKYQQRQPKRRPQKRK